MFFAYNSILTNSNSLFKPVLFLLLLFFFAACNPLPDDHHDYFDSIFYKVDTTVYEHKKQAIANMDDAFYAFTDPGAGDKAERFYRKRYYYFFVKTILDTAMQYEDSMMHLVENSLANERHAEIYARSLFLRGHSFMALRRYDEAYAAYYQAKQVMAQYVKFPCRLSEYGSSMANIYFVQGKYLLAARYYRRQYNEMLGCTDDHDRETWMSKQGCLNNIGLSYFRAGMQDSGSFYYNEALKVIDITDHKFPNYNYSITIAKAVVFANQADIFGKAGRFTQAEDLFMQSIRGTTSGDPMYTQTTLLKLGNLYFENDKLSQTYSVMQQLEKSLDTLSNEGVMLGLYKLEVDYYIRVNAVAPIRENLKKYFTLKDSLETRDKKFIAIDISREFENREQKSVNETLKKDNELKTVYLLIAVITSCMAVVIILLVLHNLKRSAKHVNELENLNTEIHQKNEDLQKTLISLEQSHSENTRIVRVVAHDLKNPVSAIQNLVYSLMKKEQPPGQREILELIKTACTNSITLINDLLSKNKKTADVRKEMVDMARLLEYCVELLQAKADEKNQILKLQAEHAMIFLNRQKMWRVISNIVNNAIKFSPDNTVIDIRLQKKEGAVLFSVQDRGIGIPAELKDKIFALTPEASRPGTSGEQSHGLGLSISQKIVEEHNGKIWFESLDGEGSAFYVELPL